MSHLGRPDGKVVAKYSLKPVSDELSKLLNKPVTFLEDCVGSEIEAACKKASNGNFQEYIFQVTIIILLRYSANTKPFYL